MKVYLLCLVFLVALMITVCSSGSSTGRKRLGPVAAATIRNGISTKFEVRALLGAPRTIERRVPVRQPVGTEPLPAKYTASEIWTFQTSEAQNSASLNPAMKHPRYIVVVFFDERGIVLDCRTEMASS